MVGDAICILAVITGIQQVELDISSRTLLHLTLLLRQLGSIELMLITYN